MLKNSIILLSLLLTSPVFANEQKNPNIFGIEIDSHIDYAKKSCKRHKGVWYASKLNLFSCKGRGFNVIVEADGDEIVKSVYVNFRQARFYNEELKSFIKNYNNLRSIKNGANNTVINEFNNTSWFAYFMVYGENKSYVVYLYNTKEMLNK